ncbi:carboxyl-terminal processing protease CtpC [Chamaesiphon minutus]|uniref:Carboxyl-terminal-processing protease n=1 Tax=Chamaesiphon minutus (strain ATCC 27169 / PCC 6605) TaxID=1173020 RepID=K9UJX6_CHAP6|nr:carboxyl-terminal processing protease CtpC [Chamaesiphon minutus]AFY94746.1 C-terminal processing peptidase [Chamaesiphon minutus PCC 6605]
MKIEKHGLVIGATTLVLTAVAVTGAGLHLPRGVAFFKNSPKELLDEVWQVVDKQYVDATFNQKDWRAIRTQYVVKGNYKSKEEVYKAARSMLKNLNDPYTRFMDPKEFRDLQVETSGQLIGVGIQLSQNEKTKRLEVIAPIEDTSASKAGILSKDIITKIDGKSTVGMDVNKAVQLIRGKEGTTVKLTILRDNRQTLEFNLLRQQIEIHPVEAKYRPKELNGIGYIRLKQFSANASTEMGAAIQKLESQGAKGYVLDLRSNPGGLLYGAIDIARMWLDDGKIVSTVNRRGTDDISVANNTAITKKPLVVLVDGGSASASEILSGALQDNKRAQLVGVKTFGKGLVQSVRPLSEGAGMAVTIAKYFTPSGKDINRAGIKPDVEVKLSKTQIQALVKDRAKVATVADPQYAKALQVLQVEIARNGSSAQKK